MDRRRIERDLAGVLNEMENTRDNRKFVVGEIIFLSAVIAYYFQSLTALFVAVIVLAILFVIPYLRVVIFLLLSAIWGAIAYAVLAMFISHELAIAGGILIFLLIFFIHKGS